MCFPVPFFFCPTFSGPPESFPPAEIHFDRLPAEPFRHDLLDGCPSAVRSSSRTTSLQRFLEGSLCGYTPRRDPSVFFFASLRTVAPPPKTSPLTGIVPTGLRLRKNPCYLLTRCVKSISGPPPCSLLPSFPRLSLFFRSLFLKWHFRI